MPPEELPDATEAFPEERILTGRAVRKLSGADEGPAPAKVLSSAALAKITIPTLPSVVGRVETLANDPDSGLCDIANVVSQDAPLAAKVLKIANSAFYGLRERCASTQQAAAVLGLRVIRNAVLQAAVIQQYAHLTGSGFDLDGLWRHSILTAQTSSFLVRRCRGRQMPTPDEAYVCGLLHDLGQVVMLDALRDRYLAAVAMARAARRPLFETERARLGIDHADVGYRIAQAWNLPACVQTAIRYHHGPAEQHERDAASGLIGGVDLLTHAVVERGGGSPEECFLPAVRAALGLELPDVEAAIAFAQQALGAIEV